MLKQSLQAIGFLVAIVCLLNSSPLFAQSPPDNLWTRTFGGAGSDRAESVCQTTDECYIIAGSTLSFGAGDHDVWLIKTDANGDTLWTKTYGCSHSDNGYSVYQTSDGEYIITGGTWSFSAGQADVYLIKTDSNGDAQWTKTYGGTGSEIGYSVCQTIDEGYIIAGYTSSFGAGGNDVYLIMTAPEPVGIDNQESLPSCSPFLQNYTNPFSSKTSIKYSLSHPGNVQVEIYNIKGQLVETLLDKDTSIGFHTIEWDAQDMTLGIFFCKLVADKKETVGKMVLIML